MTYKLLDGKALSKVYHAYIKSEVLNTEAKLGRVPGLGVILVGNNPASEYYVRTKERVATKHCGFKTFDIKLGSDASYSEVKAAIESFNSNAEVDGILLQLPLPGGLDSDSLLDEILPEKDVDGLHPLNQGLLQKAAAKLIPCTPLGCMKLIDAAYSEKDIAEISIPDLLNVDLSGKKAVVIGRSLLVGKPAATLLLERNATVSIVHSKTEHVAAVCAEADILVAAVGRPHMVTSSWVKEGAIVIDVGINRLEDGSLVGDVDFDAVKDKTSAITPVPGGVGPMTVAMLMLNTLSAFKGNIQQEL